MPKTIDLLKATENWCHDGNITLEHFYHVGISSKTVTLQGYYNVDVLRVISSFNYSIDTKGYLCADIHITAEFPVDDSNKGKDVTNTYNDTVSINIVLTH